MSRRARTLIPGVVILAILIILAATLPVPYVVLSPGPTLNTLGSYETAKGSRDVIEITGRDTNSPGISLPAARNRQNRCVSVPSRPIDATEPSILKSISLSNVPSIPFPLPPDRHFQSD